MRILHLIAGRATPSGVPDRAAMAPLLACARCIADSPADIHRVVLLGGTDARTAAALAQLPVHRSISPPLGMAGLAWSGVRDERGWKPQRVSLWSPGLGGLARQLAPATLDHTPWTLDAPWSAECQPVVCTPSTDDRTSLRSLLGASDSELVVALVADPPGEGDARRFAFNLGLIEVGIGPIMGVMADGSHSLDRARRFHRLSTRRSPLVVVRGSVLPWLHAADVGVLDGNSRHTRVAAELSLVHGLTLVAPSWLGTLHPEHVGTRLFLSDGQTRTMLPALLRALSHGPPGIAPDAPRVQQSIA